MLIVPSRIEANMQGPGQPGMMPGSAGYQAMLYQMQAGQFASTGQSNMAPRLALVQGGARPAAMNAAALAAAAPGGASYRPASAQMSMGMLLKAPARKTGAGQQKGRKHCNCKNSRCLKLYCECFASGRYCDNCNCVTCYNNKECETMRQQAVEAILERNPNAFRPKIQTAEGDTHPQSIRNAPDGTVRHTKGCNCKKSACLKKYCECFQGNIFCTEVCKCVDCKNYDGSEARAQVLSVQEPFSMHQLQQAAAQHAMKRPRLQLPQAAMQPQSSAGMLQAHNAYQQLAVAATGAPPHAMQPLQQMPTLPAAAPATVPAASEQQTIQTPQLPSRHPLLDVVHDLVKPELIEELGQLLVLVAKEEADKQQHLQQQHMQQQHMQQQQHNHPDAAAEGTNGLLKVKHELLNGVSQAASAADGVLQEAVGQRNHSSSPPDAAVNLAPVKAETSPDTDGDTAMQDMLEPDLHQVQQSDAADGTVTVTDAYEAVSDAYAAQEAVVLQEFNAILERIVAQAEKKSSSLAAAAATAPSSAATTPTHVQQIATVASTASADAVEQQAQQQEQQQHQQAQLPQGQPQPAQVQQPVLQQQFLQQQQVQQTRPLAAQQRQPVLTIPQQSMMLPANGNLALAQLQQASRHAAFIQAAGQPYQAGLGVQMAGMRSMGIGMPQMVQVMAQDGSVHQIPASSLMQWQFAAAAQAQQAVPPVAQQMPQQLPQQPTAAGCGQTQPAGLGVSLLSLLNGTNGSTPSS